MAKEKLRSEETTQLIRKSNFLEKWHSLLMQVYMISAIILTIYSVCNFGLPSTSELTGEKLTVMKYSGAISYTVHEHRGFCKKDEESEVN